MVRSILSGCCGVLVLLCGVLQTRGADEAAPAGKQTLQLGEQAQIVVPEGYRTLNGDETRAMLKQHGEPTSPGMVGYLEPDGKDANWALFFDFDSVGYVKDEEKDKLDADAILDSLRRGNEHANVDRRKNNAPELQITGWHTKPKYNDATKNLEWCIAATANGRPLLNYNIRMLGRDGVMAITLVCDPGSLDSDLPKARSLLNGFSFVSGKKYAEWTAGDKVAEYGLTALVAGGAVAVALKTGLLQKLIKPIIIGVAALGGLIAKLFGRRKES